MQNLQQAMNNLSDLYDYLLMVTQEKFPALCVAFVDLYFVCGTTSASLQALWHCVLQRLRKQALASASPVVQATAGLPDVLL